MPKVLKNEGEMLDGFSPQEKSEDVINVSNGEIYTFEEVSKITRLSQNDITDFFILRGYIKHNASGYTATSLGMEKGCVLNDTDFNALVTAEGISRVMKAFLLHND